MSFFTLIFLKALPNVRIIPILKNYPLGCGERTKAFVEKPYLFNPADLETKDKVSPLVKVRALRFIAK